MKVFVFTEKQVSLLTYAVNHRIRQIRGYGLNDEDELRDLFYLLQSDRCLNV